MEPSISTSLQSRLDNKEYKDLTGRIKRDEGQFPAHTGGYSDVFTGFLAEQKVAIKVLRTAGDRQGIATIKKYLSREAAVWSELKHPNVLGFLGLANDLGRDKNCPALIAPYCVNGTSRDFIRLKEPPIQTRILLILGVARGLEYLHTVGVVHGDLKPSNVLIGDNDEPLLCDFGRSKILDLRGFTTKPAGAVRYQARELLEGSATPNRPTDVCSLGLTAFELWTGILPYAGIRNDNAVIKHIIVDNLRQELPQNPAPAMHEVLWPILEPCLSHGPNDRPDMYTVVQMLESCVSSFS